jgi:hypothetical protein
MTKPEAQWSPVKHLILGDDPQLRVYAEVSVWFKKVEMFRQGEDQQMYAQEPTPADVVVHKTLVQRLITDGDHLVLLIQQVGLPSNIDEVQAEDVAAAVEALRDTYRGWHEAPSAARRAEVLREVFPDVT